MANNGIYYSSGNTLNFTTNDTTWATLTSGGTFVINTVSGGTYQNLPSSTFTGGTVTGATNFTSGLTASTISATTLSLPFTTGSVIFQGSGGTLTQSNSQLFWDNTNNRLGIGTSSPTTNLNISGAGSTTASIKISTANRPNGMSFNYGDTSNVGTIDYSNVFYITKNNGTFFPFYISSGNNVLINSITDGGYQFDVNGTARFTNYVYAQSGVTVGGTGGVAGVFPAAGSVLNRETVVLRGGLIPSDAGDDIVLSNGQGDAANTSSTRTLVNISRGFNPISGTGVYNILRITSPINQTGGASGITRGLYVNPTLTSAADFRAIEVERGKVILNSISGNTLIGTTADTGTYKLDVRGLTRFSAATGTSLTVISSGNSTSAPVFSVQGSQGELFSVTDSLTGSLFSVSDISGLPIMEVFSDSTIVLGDYQAPSLYTTKRVSSITATTGTTIYSFPTSAYTSSFVDYYVSGSTGLRAGNIMAIWSGSSVNFTETSTNDIGVTTPVTFGYTMSGSSAVLRASASTGTWIVESILRGL